MESRLQRILRSLAIIALSLCMGSVVSMAMAQDASLVSLTERIQIPKPTTTSGQSATLLSDGNWLLLGGRDKNGSVSNQALLLDSEFQPLQTLSQHLRVARSGHTATVLPDGTVLILGGTTSNGTPITALEKYHPDTQQFELVGDVGIPARAGHTATLLTDGHLLMVGGTDVTALVHRDALLIDPATWQVDSVSSTMLHERQGQWASLLPSNTVLIWRGSDQAKQAVTTAELFNADTKQFSPLDAATVNQLPITAYVSMLPTVNAVLPAAGSSDVAVATKIVTRFSKPLQPSTLNNQTVTLIGPNGAVRINVTAAESGLLLFVTPVEDLLPDSDYNLFIQGMQDAQDNALPLFSSSFHTTALTKTHRESVTAQPVFIDKELWTPSGKRRYTDWRSGNAKLALTHLPKRSVVAKAVHGKTVKNSSSNAPAGVTALAGQVLKLTGEPLAQVTLSIGSHSVTTDKNGEFLLSDIPDGAQTLVIDGSTVNTEQRSYGRYEYRATIVAHKTTSLPFVIWMSRLDTEHQVSIASPTSGETVVTNPAIPGLELHLPTGTVIRDAQGKIVTTISITAIPVDQPPFPLPNLPVPVYFTIQPGGAQLQTLSVQGSTGARLIYPNFTHADPGSRIDFWNYDSHDKGWYVYGQGTVSADGKQVIPDDGVVIHEFSGAMVSLPSNAPAEGPPVDSCDAGDPVDCFTGLFVHDRTDLAIDDVYPIEVRRIYRPRDNIVRAFGIGANLSYDLFLVGDVFPYTYMDLILPDGGRVHYARTSSGTGYTDAAYTNTTTPGAYYGSTIHYVGDPVDYWELDMPDGSVITFPEAYKAQYARWAAATGMRDRFGNALTFIRDAGSGSLLRVTSPSGYNIRFSYDSQNRVTQASDDIGRTVNYSYDTSGRLASVTDPASKTESYTYDSSNRMLTVTDKRGHVMVTNTYDSNGRVTLQTYADNTTASFAYTLDTNGKVTQTDFTNERGIVRRTQFNTAGLPISITNALGRTEQQTTTLTRDPTTNLVQSMTDALGRQTTYQYDIFGMGNVTQVTYLSGTGNALTWQYAYGPTAKGWRLSSMTDPLNHTTNYTQIYQTGLLTRITDPLGQITNFTYNAKGQVITRQQFVGSTALTTSYSYNGGSLASMTDPLNRTTTFFQDPVGRTIRAIDPLNHIQQFSYDAMDRVISTTDALNRITQLSYDGNSNLLSVQDANNHTTQFSYDLRDRLSSKTDALLHVDNYQYDAAGNLASHTDRKAQVSGFSYDGLNRLTGAGYGATVTNPTTYQNTIAYTWDAGNRLTSVVDSVSGTITRQYDGVDRLTQEHSPQGQVDYTYYGNGLRQTMTVLGQSAINYGYDNANRLTQLTQGSATTSLSYDSANRRTSLTLPNGVQVSYGYDNANELTSLTYQKGSTTLGTLTYGYDLAGRRTSAGGTFAPNTLPPVITTTAYDANNHLTNWNGATLTYDNNGNLLSDGTRTYTWNSRNQLASISGSAVASFQYDAFNRRVTKTVNSTSTNYLNDGWQVVQELNGTTPTANLLTGDIDEVFRRTEGSTSRDYLIDALGSTIALTDSSGAIQTSYSYDPYGSTTVSGAGSTNTYQYTGRENDGTGTYYYRNRYYNPSFNRYISEDPIGLAGGINTSAYVDDNPIIAFDPSGLDATVCHYPSITGHVGIGINSSSTQGFYPKQKTLSDLIGAPGEVKPDKEVAPDSCKTISTTPAQDKKMSDYIKEASNSPREYSLTGSNCVKFVRDVLKAGDIPTPNVIYPQSLMNGLPGKTSSGKH